MASRKKFIQFIFSWTNKKGRIDSKYEFGINSAFNFKSFDILDDHYRFVEKNHKSPRKTTTTVSLKKLQVPEQDDHDRFVDLCRLNTNAPNIWLTSRKKVGWIDF